MKQRLKPGWLTALATAALVCLTGPLHAELLVHPGDVVVVSVETLAKPRMASVDIAAYFLMCQPVDGIEVVQSCFREDTTERFMQRIETDIAPWKPAIALISHGGNEGRSDPGSRGLTFYHPTYLGKTVDSLHQAGVRTVVLGSSACVDATLFHKEPVEAKTWNKNLTAFCESDRRLATQKGAVFADVFTSMFDAMTKAKKLYGDAYALTDANGYYPMPNGGLVIASAFLKALGCDGAIGTITVDLAANKAVGTPGQEILSCRDGAVEVESARYPFCFEGAVDKPGSTSGIVECFPFNEELNRYLLVVKNFGGARAKVTWGGESREFSAADLAKGVNLAAAFAAHTPFDQQFAKVENAIWAQQGPQSLFTDNFFHNLADYKKMAPNAGSSIEQISSAILKQDKTLAEAAQALVVPIRHSLKIEALP